MNLSLDIVNQRITVEKVHCTITVGGNKKCRGMIKVNIETDKYNFAVCIPGLMAQVAPEISHQHQGWGMLP